jgi:uncharacterized protein YbjT (DUF2867 family)
MDKMLLVGATGMVGRAVRTSAGDAPLTLLARRAMDDLPAHQNVIVAEGGDWPAAIGKLRPIVIFNALGTTIKQAGSQAAFRAVDHDLVLAVAGAAKAAGARHFISVSSVGASAKSSNFYLRTKGEVEAALRALDFERLDIVRPGLLTGERGGPFRPGEAIAMVLAPFTDLMLHGGARRYRSVAGATVAQAMLALASGGGAGVHVHEHDAIIDLASEG